MTIYDSFSHKGYDVQLVDGYETRVINPNGKIIASVPQLIRKTEKWKEFTRLRAQHRKDVTASKTELLSNMMSRKNVDITRFLVDKSRQNLANGKTILDIGDFHDVTRNMYVEATTINREIIRGFVTGINDNNQLLVDKQPVIFIKLLHPLEIPNIKEIQIRAIKELRDTHIIQLFRPVYKPEPDEEYYVTRFMEIPVEPKKFIPISSSYSWRTRSRQSGTIEKMFEGSRFKYLVVFQYSLDYPENKTTWEIGNVEFMMIYEGMEPQPCRCFDVDPVVFTEVVWELDKIVNSCRTDDEVSKTMMEQRQSIAKMYAIALGLKNCEIYGNTVKIYGEWGIYGVSLVDARAYWWKDKQYICIQPKTGHENPKFGAFLLGDDVLEDPTLALAIAKINALCDDSHPIDSVLDNQIRPTRPGISRKGEALDEIKLEMGKIIN